MPADTAEPLAPATEVAAPDLANDSAEETRAPLAQVSGHAIRLNFINQSNDRNNSEIVIFSRNVAVSLDEVAVAWQVIKNCGQGWSHPFVYPMDTEVSVSDSWGNFSPRFTAQSGQAFALEQTASGDTLSPAGLSNSPSEIELRNNLPMGAMTANVYKDGKLFAARTSIAPGQKAVFQFKPTLWIGVASQVVEGQVMNAAIISQVNTEIALLGIASADIIMSGGGPGPSSRPFSFNLENVVYA